MSRKRSLSRQIKAVFIILLISSFGAGAILFANSTLKQDTEFRSQAWGNTGANFYVDKDGVGGKGCNDAWPGTLEQPFCTIPKGLATFQPGDNLYVRAGTYPGFTFTRSGSPNYYFNISAYNSERPLIKGGEDPIKLHGTSYVRINGFEVTGSTSPWYGGGIRLTYNGSSLPTHNIIENNYVHDNQSANISGILIEDGSFNQILHNTVQNNYLTGIWVVAHPNISSSGISGNQIIGNTVSGHLNGGGNSDGIKIEGSGAKQNLIKDNTVYANGDDGIDVWNTSANQIIGNRSYNHLGPGDGNGFKLGGSTTGGSNYISQNIAFNNKYNGFDNNGSGGNIYHHNTSYNNGSFGFEDGWKNQPCTPSTCQTTYINNLGYNNKRGNLSASAYTAISHNNLWYDDTTASPKIMYDYTLYHSLAEFFKASGNRLDNPSGGELASLAQHPALNDPTNQDFNLKSSSPAIDKGDKNNPANINYHNLPDIGALEYLSTPSSSPTPTATPTPSPISTPTPLNDTTPPTTSLTYPTTPLNLARGSKITLTAIASDNSQVKQVVFYQNNSAICTTTNSPYQCNWKLPNSKGKTYEIYVIATDQSGNTTKSNSAIITVN